MSEELPQQEQEEEQEQEQEQEQEEEQEQEQKQEQEHGQEQEQEQEQDNECSNNRGLVSLETLHGIHERSHCLSIKFLIGNPLAMVDKLEFLLGNIIVCHIISLPS